MNLVQYRNKVAGNLSGGNKRKLSVAIAMIGNPPIILLDEPSTGVDPEARRFMWSVIHKISIKRKLSTVILTTHSMEEAETLCKKIGIMINGQFRCLGTSQSLKNKYGHGYEIDLRIQNTDITGKNKMGIIQNNIDNVIQKEDFNEFLDKISKIKFAKLINYHGLGSKILDDINIKNQLSEKKLRNWLFFTENILRICKKIKEIFPQVFISEFYDNNFKIKMKKRENENISIGTLFGIFEDIKNTYHISEYGISQTSLEQIFNQFARENEKSESQNGREIQINQDLLDILD